jgi:predicted metal-binding protein
MPPAAHRGALRPRPGPLWTVGHITSDGAMETLPARERVRRISVSNTADGVFADDRGNIPWLSLWGRPRGESSPAGICRSSSTSCVRDRFSRGSFSRSCPGTPAACWPDDSTRRGGGGASGVRQILAGTTCSGCVGRLIYCAWANQWRQARLREANFVRAAEFAWGEGRRFSTREGPLDGDPGAVR